MFFTRFMAFSFDLSCDLLSLVFHSKTTAERIKILRQRLSAR